MRSVPERTRTGTPMMSTVGCRSPPATGGTTQHTLLLYDRNPDIHALRSLFRFLRRLFSITTPATVIKASSHTGHTGHLRKTLFCHQTKYCDLFDGIPTCLADFLTLHIISSLRTFSSHADDLSKYQGLGDYSKECRAESPGIYENCFARKANVTGTVSAIT